MSQQSLFLTSKQGPFAISDCPIPDPKAGEVLVRIIAAGLNPIDAKMQKLGSFVEKYPAVIGVDFSGTVEKVGEGVEGWAIGDKVCATPLGGAFQQFVTIPVIALTKVPDSMSMDAAASVAACLGTAAIGLLSPMPCGLGLDPLMSFPSSSPYDGRTALVIGGSTSTGQYAIQILRLLGFTKIITYASVRHANYLQSLGATTCIDRAITPISELAKILSSEDITTIYDTVGEPETQQSASDCLGSGTFVSVKTDARANKTPEVSSIYVRGSVLFPGNVEFNSALGNKMAELLESGKIIPNRIEVLPGGLEGVQSGIDRHHRGEVSCVKLVVHPQDV